MRFGSVAGLTHPRPAGAGHRGPEETPPVLVLKDVGEDASEDSSAVQEHLLLLLAGAAGLGTLHQLLHRLGQENTRGTLFIVKRK